MCLQHCSQIFNSVQFIICAFSSCSMQNNSQTLRFPVAQLSQVLQSRSIRQLGSNMHNCAASYFKCYQQQHVTTIDLAQNITLARYLSESKLFLHTFVPLCLSPKVFGCFPWDGRPLHEWGCRHQKCSPFWLFDILAQYFYLRLSGLRSLILLRFSSPCFLGYGCV